MTDFDARLHMDKVLYSTQNAPPPSSLPNQDRKEREELRASSREGEKEVEAKRPSSLTGRGEEAGGTRGGGGVLSDLERVAPLLTRAEREQVCSLCACSPSMFGIPVPAPFLLGVGGLVGLLAGTLCGGRESREKE